MRVSMPTSPTKMCWMNFKIHNFIDHDGRWKLMPLSNEISTYIQSSKAFVRIVQLTYKVEGAKTNTYNRLPIVDLLLITHYTR